MKLIAFRKEIILNAVQTYKKKIVKSWNGIKKSIFKS